MLSKSEVLHDISMSFYLSKARCMARIKAMKKNVTLFAQAEFPQFSKHMIKLMDYAQHIATAVLIVILLSWGISSSQQPISDAQHQHLQRFASQALYSNSRETANYLLNQAQISQAEVNQFQYFKWLRVHQREQQRIHFQKSVEVE